MTHILSNLPEEYQKSVEILKEKLDKKYHPLTIERIGDKLSVKFYKMNEQSETKTATEDEKPLYIKYQYKGTCTPCGIYRHKVRD